VTLAYVLSILLLLAFREAPVPAHYSLAVRTDNGPEFTSRAFMGWASTHGIRHILIESGRPMQNDYIESFNGKFRNECLNEQWFETLQQARSAIAVGSRTTARSGRTAAAGEYHRPSLPRSIASALAILLGPVQTPPRSINLATQDFLVMNGTAEGGRSVSPTDFFHFIVPEWLVKSADA
jgi:hypothetical protein